MRFWIVSELFYPEEVSTGYVMTKIAEKLSEHEEVGVICGPIGYQAAALRSSQPISHRIQIQRINIPRMNKNKLVLRALSFFILSIGIFWKVIIHVKKGDRLLLVTNPPILLPFISFLKRIKGFSFVILIHDVFPENAVAGDLLKKGSFLYRMLEKIFKNAYHHADKLIVVGNDMGNLISKKLKKKIPIEVITNWADHEHVLSLNIDNYHRYYGLPKQADDRVFIQFAGNIGRVQGLEMFFKLIAKSRKRDYNLIIIGDGAIKLNLETITNQCHLDNVHFFDSKSRSEQCTFLNNMDIGLVTLSPGMYGLGVPSKVYNIFSAGKPVLFIGEEGAEIAEYIRLYNVGWAFDWKQEEQIQSFLETIGSISKEEIKLKGRNARLLVERKFNQPAILAAFEKSVSF